MNSEAIPACAAKSAPPSFDLRWLRWSVTLLLPTLGLNAADNEIMFRVGLGASVLVGILLCFYYAHILLRRLQCSLLEMTAILAALGNAEGLLLTTPGLMTMKLNWVVLIAFLVAAWILHGATSGLVHARLLRETRTHVRLAWIIFAWLSIASPALLGTGALLVAVRVFASQKINVLISPGMFSFAPTLLLLGAAGLVMHGLMTRRAIKIAGEILGRPT